MPRVKLTALMLEASQPARILTVTGTETASATALTMAKARSWLAHQGSAFTVVYNFRHRAAHIDVITCAPCCWAMRAASAMTSGFGTKELDPTASSPV